MIDREQTVEQFPRLDPEYTPDGRIDHSFSPFAGLGIHFGWMRTLGAKGILSIQPNEQVLISGAGPGDEPKAYLETIPEAIRPKVRIIVAEPNERELSIARQKLAPFGDTFQFLQTDAIQTLKDGLRPNLILFNAAIHLLPEIERPTVVKGMYESLPPGGRAIIVSTFITEWQRENQGNFYLTWMLETRKILRDKDSQLFQITRAARGKSGSHVVNQMWSVEKYKETFLASGFDLDFFEYDTENVIMQVPYKGFFNISQYEEWINGSCPVKTSDEPINDQEYQRRMDIVTQAQQQALAEVFPQHFKIGETSPRNQMVAVLRKPA